MLKLDVVPTFASISVYKKPTESNEKVLKSIRNTLVGEGFNIEKETLPSWWGGTIFNYRVRLTKSSAGKVFKNLVKNLEGTYPDWIKERFDSKDQELYIRIDKQLAFIGVLKISRGDNIIHFKFSFPGYLKLTPEKLGRKIREIRKNS